MSLPQKLLSRKDEITRDFLLLVDQHISDLMQEKTSKRLATKDFAALLFIAPRHLTNTIKLCIDKSPCDVMEERLQAESERMLLETDLPLREISYRCGYQDTTNFIKFFKGMTGVTPLQYRKGKTAPLLMEEGQAP